jgi:hypothetical protein
MASGEAGPNGSRCWEASPGSIVQRGTIIRIYQIWMYRKQIWIILNIYLYIIENSVNIAFFEGGVWLKKKGEQRVKSCESTQSFLASQ